MDVMEDSESLTPNDVLEGASNANAGNVVAYLHFSYDPMTDETTVSVRSQATPAGDAVQEKIVLPKVDVTVLGTSDHDIVHNLFAYANPHAE